MKIKKTLKTLLGALVLGLSLGASHVATAQDKAPIRLLVGFPPGGSTDTVARLLADRLATELKQTILVENKPGAGGRLAAQLLKSSAPDGLTYMIAPNATPVMQTLLYSPEVLKYDMLKDLAPVAVLVNYPLALAVNAQSGVKTAKEYEAWLKANPKDALYGTAGAGGQTHFSGLQLGKVMGQALVMVPYRGNGPLLTDLLGAQVPAGIMTAGDVLAHQKGGKLRLVGQFGAKRSPLLPDVPTFIEQGYNIDTGDAWTGVWAPAKTPKAELDRVQSAIKHVLSMPEVRDQLINKATLNPNFMNATEMDELQRKDLQYWAPIIKESNFKPES
jgi:tripartite-type tricarboxylate transporter receptor subunit TctC